MNLSMKAARAEFKSVTDGARLELRMKRTPVVEVLRSVRFVIFIVERYASTGLVVLWAGTALSEVHQKE